MRHRDVLIWLNNLVGVNNRHLEYLDDSLDLAKLWEMDSFEIDSLPIGEKLKQSIREKRDKSCYERILEEAYEKDIDIITKGDKNYPSNLIDIPDAPRVLYVKGRIDEKDDLSIAIVGPRKASSYGLWAAESISTELSKLGITIVSGMALGVDAAAHIAALRNNSRTIAVLGTGADVIYPAKNSHIYKKIADDRGAVLSEFPLGSQGLPYRFPQRNRIISGMTLGTVIIEAAERSGTLTTVQHGLEQGREIFAVPGNINSLYSKGTNSLIKDGAKLVQDIDDILVEISELKSLIEREREETMEELSEAEKSIIKQIKVEPLHVEQISLLTGQSIQKTLSTLTVLEIKQKTKKIKGNKWTIR